MKTSEQMTIDVLKRRDEALKAKRSPARRIAAIAVPCAAALAITAVAAGVNSIHGRYVHKPIAKPENAGTSEPGRPDIASISNIEDITLKNPNAGKYNYHFVFANHLIEGVKFIEGYPDYESLSKPEYTFTPNTPQELNSYYGIEFDRLSRLHSDWSENIDHPLGIYYHDYSDDTISSREIICTTNTLNYTTPDGASVTVTAQNREFISTFNGFHEACDIGSGPYITYNENGDKVGELDMGFWPNPCARRIYNRDFELYSFDVQIYTNTDDHNTHLAYLDMGAWVRIYAEGLSDEEFFDLIKEYTA